jgi:hypothetical protein
MEAHRAVRRRGLHILYTVVSQMAVRLLAIRAIRSLPPMNIPGTPESTPGS